MVLQICRFIISTCDFHLNNFQLQSLHVFIKSHLVTFLVLMVRSQIVNLYFEPYFCSNF
jgi:hypothetical protein